MSRVSALLLASWAAAAGATEPTVLVLGDSLSSSYGIAMEAGWVALLEARLGAEGYPHVVVNASVSGDTSAGGASRLPALLEAHRPAVLVVELGGNDGLRGIPPTELRTNLRSIVEAGAAAGARVVLVAMKLPPNYGPVYARRFEAVYGELATETGALLAPFLLEGIGTDPALMQPDGIHAAAAAQPRVLENLWPTLRSALGAPTAP